MPVIITNEATERDSIHQRARNDRDISLEIFRKHGWRLRHPRDASELGGFYHFVRVEDSRKEVKAIERNIGPCNSITYPVHFWFYNNEISIYEKNPQKREAYLENLKQVAEEISSQTGKDVKISL